jgi:hypothetical protein
MENVGFGALCRLGRARPRLIPALNRFSSAALSTRTYTDTSHRVFVTPRGSASPSPSTPFHVNHWAR